MDARRLGYVDRLGYLYCAVCHPEETAADPYPVWSDQSAHIDEPCELCHTPLNAVSAKGTEAERNKLAARVAQASRRAGSPINAYHARADIDEWLNRGLYLRDLPGLYERHYGVAV